MGRTCGIVYDNGQTSFCPRFTRSMKRPCDLLPKGITISEKRFLGGEPQTFCPIEGGEGAAVKFNYDNLARVDFRNAGVWKELAAQRRKADGV